MTVDFSYFGKLPAFGDFVRWNAAGNEVQQFDEWLQEGLYHAKKDLRSDFNTLFDALTLGFFSPDRETGNILVGGLRASRDKIGRHYPFYVTILLQNAEIIHNSSPEFSGPVARFLRQVFPFMSSIQSRDDISEVEQEFRNFSESVLSGDDEHSSPVDSSTAEALLIPSDSTQAGYQVELESGEPIKIYPVIEKIFRENSPPYIFWHAREEESTLYLFGTTPPPEVFTSILAATVDSQFIEKI